MSAEHLQGTAQAVRSIIDQHGAELHRYLMRRLRHAQNALDLAQEVYLRLLRATTQDQIQDFRAYVYQVAANVVHEFKYRARESHVRVDSQAVEDWAKHPSGVQGEDLSDDVAYERLLEQAFDKLPPRCQAAFLLEVRDGCSHEEVAQRLGTSVRMVKKYMVRAAAVLRTAVQPRVNDQDGES